MRERKTLTGRVIKQVPAIDLGTRPAPVWFDGRSDFFYHNGVQIRFCRTPRDYGGHLSPPIAPQKPIADNPWAVAAIIIALVVVGVWLW